MSIKDKARILKRQVYVVYLAARHPATPWYVKALAAVIVAYAFSPIDLVPDFIPVLGYLDDVILIPLGIALLLKLTPAHIIDACRAEAETLAQQKKPINYYAATVIVLVWLASITLCLYWLTPYLNL